MVMLHDGCMRRARRIRVIVVTGFAMRGIIRHRPSLRMLRPGHTDTMIAVFSMPRVRAVHTMFTMVTVPSRGLCACTQGQGSHGGYRQQRFD